MDGVSACFVHDRAVDPPEMNVPDVDFILDVQDCGELPRRNPPPHPLQAKPMTATPSDTPTTPRRPASPIAAASRTGA